MMSSSGHYQQIEVTFTGKQIDLKNKIQLHVGLGIEGLAETLEPTFHAKLPATEAVALWKTNNTHREQILAREKNSKMVNMIVMG